MNKDIIYSFTLGLRVPKDVQVGSTTEICLILWGRGCRTFHLWSGRVGWENKARFY